MAVVGVHHAVVGYLMTWLNRCRVSFVTTLWNADDAVSSWSTPRDSMSLPVPLRGTGKDMAVLVAN